MTITKETILSHLKSYNNDLLQTDLVSAKCIKSIVIEADKVNIDIELGFPANSIKRSLQSQVNEYLVGIDGITEVTVNVTWKVTSHSVQSGVKGLPSIKNIIAVASGKGGVGKSTTSVNLALALQAEGARVGLLDADIYGPSQPQMLGSYEQPQSNAQNTLEPIVRHGLQTMSIGYLIDQDSAVIWRGPMVSGALQQLLHDTQWQDLDYLIIDLPPGTGDIQLTLSQKIPVSGAVIVTTPQDLALLDAKKAIAMFNKVSVPVLGIIENMSIYVCTNCGHQAHLFGAGGGQRIANKYHVPLLGELPLDNQIREQADSGHPTVACEPDCDISQMYRNIASKMAAKLSLQTKNLSGRFPKIVVENN